MRFLSVLIFMLYNKVIKKRGGANCNAFLQIIRPILKNSFSVFKFSVILRRG
ncbi:hypothetical protein GGTG_11540 [Gaeumannomyces tritici R3-111a-1]|uniref:Uncharacterized protein n=1 Tax=Gaeumannomyces tritici (strain R3-111a-1) TaxID=644352 RepID=J3PDG9_GAET3|nr:hypothetical protein GGTG_11540 [Gaeumannomyces tritici R3-111a-1]EJT70517.1 hypothetical protein GGTG_11540 [Gaeumannomyces tritici R3-111a-1]